MRRPTKFELVINRAKALVVSVPTVLATPTRSSKKAADVRFWRKGTSQRSHPMSAFKTDTAVCLEDVCSYRKLAPVRDGSARVGGPYGASFLSSA